jgi:O-methyltransferase
MLTPDVTSPHAGSAPVVSLYLDLLKLALTGALAENNDDILGYSHGNQPGIKRRIATLVGDAFLARGYEIVRKRPYDPKVREIGGDWPARAESMIGLRRMDNIRYCVEGVLDDAVPGDLIETGVWRGGAAIFMRGILKAHGVTDRCVWAADSFEGLPKPEPRQYPADEGDQHFTHDELAVGVEQVKHNFRRYGLLDDQVRFLVGWFKDTLPTAPIEQIAVLRLDGDMYESTTQAIDALYPKLSVGGYCIVDDYGDIAGCRQAILDYRGAHNITDEIVDVDGRGVFWRRSA